MLQQEAARIAVEHQRQHRQNRHPIPARGTGANTSFVQAGHVRASRQRPAEVPTGPHLASAAARGDHRQAGEQHPQLHSEGDQPEPCVLALEDTLRGHRACGGQHRFEEGQHRPQHLLTALAQRRGGGDLRRGAGGQGDGDEPQPVRRGTGPKEESRHQGRQEELALADQKHHGRGGLVAGCGLQKVPEAVDHADDEDGHQLLRPEIQQLSTGALNSVLGGDHGHGDQH
mmetsp:Transcript_50546/g.120545  ORF Transcript_50546/g.120545 Transcript_50546/m.120545 type:complete len:229 (-) Transcript_50546:302-988(-)